MYVTKNIHANIENQLGRELQCILSTVSKGVASRDEYTVHTVYSEQRGV